MGLSGRAGAALAMMAGLAGGAGHAAGDAAGEDPLAGYRWRARVLVLAAPRAGDGQLRAQREALASARRGASERDLVVLEAVGAEARAVALRRRLGLPDDAFRAVLVGKDGGPKLTSETAVPPEKLFATIDAMPMRRDEMGRR